MSPRPQRFHRRFPRYPVVLPCLSADPVQAAVRKAAAAIRTGANGVFLDWEGMSRDALHDLVRGIRSHQARAWIGLTCRSISDELIESVSPDIQGLSIRRADSVPETQLADSVDTLRKWRDWDGLLFGGLDLSDRDADHAATAVSLSRLVDVVVLEMPAPASLNRVKKVKHALGSYPVGVAATLARESIAPLACILECLVPPCPLNPATGLEAMVRSARACQRP